ncbi:MAG TPA: hypothetical protein VIY08_09805 [Candidatus Nitrosocosmicus sp.]
MTVYDLQQIRDVILKCGLNYKEVNEKDIKRNYVHPSGSIVHIDMNKKCAEEEINFLVTQIGISLEQFEQLYKQNLVL